MDRVGFVPQESGFVSHESGFVVMNHEAGEMIVTIHFKVMSVGRGRAERFHPHRFPAGASCDGMRCRRVIAVVATVAECPGSNQKRIIPIDANVAMVTQICRNRDFKHVHTIKRTNERARVGIVVTADVTDHLAVNYNIAFSVYYVLATVGVRSKSNRCVDVQRRTIVENLQIVGNTFL